MARVIFCVFCTLLILLRIFPLAFWTSLRQIRKSGISLNAAIAPARIFVIAREIASVVDIFQNFGVVGTHIATECRFERQNLLTARRRNDLWSRRTGSGSSPILSSERVLTLLQQLGHAATTFQLFAGCFVQIGSELRKRSQFTILCQVGTDTAGQVLHQALGLSSTTHTRHRDTGVDGRTDTGVEQVGFQEDLTVGNRNHVGRNEYGNVTSLVSMIGKAVSEPVLPLLHRWSVFQRSQRSRAMHAPADASGNRTRRPDKLRGPADDAATAKLAVGHSLFRQIVVTIRASSPRSRKYSPMVQPE